MATLSHRKILLLVGFIALGLTVFLKDFESVEHKDSNIKSHMVSRSTSKTNTDIVVASGKRLKIRPQTEPGLNQQPLGQEEIQSIQTLIQLATTQLQENGTKEPQSLIRSLEKLKLRPQSNLKAHAMSDMMLIRTKRTLPGTRYFHAQYFTNPDSKFYLQHLSFEMRPSDRSFQTSVEIVQKALQDAGEPEEQDIGFAAWQLENGYVLWIKRLTREDLKPDPFNAYALEDEGTIRIAIEKDPHAE